MLEVNQQRQHIRSTQSREPLPEIDTRAALDRYYVGGDSRRYLSVHALHWIFGDRKGLRFLRDVTSKSKRQVSLLDVPNYEPTSLSPSSQHHHDNMMAAP